MCDYVFETGLSLTAPDGIGIFIKVYKYIQYSLSICTYEAYICTYVYAWTDHTYIHVYIYVFVVCRLEFV